MKAKDILTQQGFTQIIFDLHFGYGYESMLKMAQFIIDRYYEKRVTSFRLCQIAGAKQREYRLRLKFHGCVIDKCKFLEEEQGALYLRGKCKNLNDQIEVLWFNQTSMFCVLASELDGKNIAFFENMADAMAEYFQCLDN